MGFGSPSVFVLEWLFGSVYVVSSLCIWIAPIMAGHKLSQSVLLVVVGMASMAASLWLSSILAAAILRYLGV